METLAFSPLALASVAVGVIVLLFTGKVLYNLFLHPLRKYPGPLLCRATQLRFIYGLVRGHLPYDVEAWHEKYGRIVRVAPSQLAFADPDSWKDIYGHRTGAQHGAEEMGKSYDFYMTPRIKPSILGETRENHGPLRKKLAHGFSEKAMRDQEPIIRGYVDLLIQRLREHCVVQETGEAPYKGDDNNEKTLKPKALDMRSWYNWTTFDVIGDLAFGESFGCLEKAEYHEWVNDIANMVSTSGIFLAAKMLHLGYPMMAAFERILPGRKHALQLSMEKVQRRMALSIERPDFLEGLLKKKKETDLDLDLGRLTSNANILVLAGSETTATLLSGVTYLLLKNPEALEKVKMEVRSSFKSEDEITLISVNNLTYMMACLNEALRCYPPTPFGMPRVVPKGGGTIVGEFIPEGTVVACWHWAVNHLAKNWEDPYSYKPERFLEGSKNGYDCFEAMQSFSIGPRNCIGRNLAYAEMRLILARILFSFDIELADPNFYWLDQKVYVLWEKPQLNVYLKPV